MGVCEEEQEACEAAETLVLVAMTGFLSKEALFTFLTGNPQQIISVHT